eukprot:gene2057-1563_t
MKTDSHSTETLLVDDSNDSDEERFIEENKNRHGNLFSSTINLMSGVASGAILTIPMTLNKSGIVISYITLLLIGFLLLIPAFLLVSSATKKRIYSLEKLSYATHGKFGSLFAKLCIFGYSFGIIVSYFIIIADLLSSMINYWLGTAIDQKIFIAISIIFILPSILLMNKKVLNYTSVVAFVCLLYIFLFVIAKGNYYLENRVVCANFNAWNIVSTFFIHIFAYSFHVNVLSIQENLYNPTQRRMGISLTTSTLLSLFIYLTTGFVGYITFSASTLENFMKNHKESDIFVQIGKIAFMIMILCSCPTISIPFKKMIINTNRMISSKSVQYPITGNVIISIAISSTTMLTALIVPNITLIFILIGIFSRYFNIFLIFKFHVIGDSSIDFYEVI